MESREKASVTWTEYLIYKARLRGFEPAKIEQILRYSAERYFDTATGRKVVVGKHDDLLVIIPYETTEGRVIPITIHPVSRRQINFRLKTGRLQNE